jgi:TyrR family helix-turn-helix protein
MRLDIHVEDRFGITGEILMSLAQNKRILLTMEMHIYHIFVHLDEPSQNLKPILQNLSVISGVGEITEIDLLPTERRRQHLEALISHLPELILDIDAAGQILAANDAAAEIFGKTTEKLRGEKITKYIKLPLKTLLSEENTTLEVVISNQPLLTDITPLKSDETGPNETGPNETGPSETGKVIGAVIVMRNMQQIGKQISTLQQPFGEDLGNIIGSSTTMQDLKKRTKRFASLELPILITGETGTGKELFAKALHAESQRSNKPFLVINCAALPENLLESELFGYADGAFSGAKKGGKPGLFELADGGSLFLDEIGEMSLYMQAKLLRCIQDQTFRRVGGTREITVNVKIISATHRNLEKRAEDGRFREDLFYRLNVLNIHLPPLRERRKDIAELTDLFLTQAAEHTGSAVPLLSPDAISALRTHRWSGNVREMQNLLFRAVALNEKSVMTHSDLQIATETSSSEPYEHYIQTDVESWQTAQVEFEKNLLSNLYPHFPSTRKLAARLKVSHNKIAQKLRKYEIE